jgi:hypothetical protein
MHSAAGAVKGLAMDKSCVTVAHRSSESAQMKAWKKMLRKYTGVGVAQTKQVEVPITTGKFYGIARRVSIKCSSIHLQAVQKSISTKDVV